MEMETRSWSGSLCRGVWYGLKAVRSCAVASTSEALAIAVLEHSSFGGWELAEVNSFVRSLLSGHIYQCHCGDGVVVYVAVRHDVVNDMPFDGLLVASRGSVALS